MRDCPGRRRSSSNCSSSCVMFSLGGTPSTTHPTPPPCDSPNVVTRNRRPKELPVARVVTVVARDVERVREGSRGSGGRVRERVGARGRRRRRASNGRGAARTRQRENGFRRRSPYLRCWGRPPRAVGSAGRGAPSLARGERSKGGSRSTSTRRRRGRTSEIRGARTGSAAGDDARGARCRANRGGAVALARAEARGDGAGGGDDRRDDHIRRDWDVRVTRKEDAGRVSRRKWLAAGDRSALRALGCRRQKRAAPTALFTDWIFTHRLSGSDAKRDASRDPKTQWSYENENVVATIRRDDSSRRRTSRLSSGLRPIITHSPFTSQRVHPRELS